VAEGINNSGEIVGWYVDEGGNFHGFVLSGVGDHTDPSAWTTIDVLHNTFIYSINAKGQIAGQYDDDAGNTHGFVGTPEH
jgi:hypothetical protein